jgi:hypothetical protein
MGSWLCCGTTYMQATISLTFCVWSQWHSECRSHTFNHMDRSQPSIHMDNDGCDRCGVHKEVHLHTCSRPVLLTKVCSCTAQKHAAVRHVLLQWWQQADQAAGRRLQAITAQLMLQHMQPAPVGGPDVQLLRVCHGYVSSYGSCHLSSVVQLHCKCCRTCHSI